MRPEFRSTRSASSTSHSRFPANTKQPARHASLSALSCATPEIASKEKKLPVPGNRLPSLPHTSSQGKLVEELVPVRAEVSGNMAAVPTLKKQRIRMSDEQTTELEAVYAIRTHPSTHDKRMLGRRIGLETKTVATWFQNRRAKFKERERPSLSASSSNSSSTSTSTLRLESVSSPSQNATLKLEECYPPPYTNNNDDPFTRSCDSPVPASELWKHLISSPTGPDSEDENAANILINVFSRGEMATSHDKPRKRFRSLDWACDRQSKKMRAERNEGDSASICSRCLQPLQLQFDPEVLNSEYLSEDVPTTTVSEDVLHAASMLLCFQYSLQGIGQS
ncbi:hypothetical protein HWV62_21230 [Athelia sp. TMB]|nr:hypothetical protein HWV62_21230 [Athelia sp. TMB]